jgi:hypothetical protein
MFAGALDVAGQGIDQVITAGLPKVGAHSPVLGGAQVSKPA